MTNSQNSGFSSQGSVKDSSQGSSYRELSQRSLTNSQRFDSSHEQHSQGSAENNSLCSSYREPSQHSLTNSQHSGFSNDQLSRNFVEDRSDSLGSRSKEPSHHSSTYSQHSQGSQQHISVGSLGNPAPSRHSQTTSQSSRVSNQLSRGVITALLDQQPQLCSVKSRENDSRSPRSHATNGRQHGLTTSATIRTCTSCSSC